MSYVLCNGRAVAIDGFQVGQNEADERALLAARTALTKRALRRLIDGKSGVSTRNGQPISTREQEFLASPKARLYDRAPDGVYTLKPQFQRRYTSANDAAQAGVLEIS